MGQQWHVVITLVCPNIPQVVSPAVCPGLPVSAALPGASGVSSVSHAGHWLPLLQEELH